MRSRTLALTCVRLRTRLLRWSVHTEIRHIVHCHCATAHGTTHESVWQFLRPTTDHALVTHEYWIAFARFSDDYARAAMLKQQGVNYLGVKPTPRSKSRAATLASFIRSLFALASLREPDKPGVRMPVRGDRARAQPPRAKHECHPPWFFIERHRENRWIPPRTPTA